jgi:hypothetical protein
LKGFAPPGKPGILGFVVSEGPPGVVGLVGVGRRRWAMALWDTRTDERVATARTAARMAFFIRPKYQ